MRFKGHDLNLLAAAEVLLTERNVSRAAERLNLSQSATSSALARLREQFGDELLVPVGRGFRLSARAEQLLPRIRSILGRVEDEIIGGSILEPRDATRHIRLMASDYVSLTALAPGLAQLSREAPGLTFEITRMIDRPFVAIEQYDVDLLVAPDVFISQKHPSRIYFDDDYVILTSRDSPWLKGRMTPERYFEAPQVIVQFEFRGNPAHDDRFLEQQGHRKRVSLAVSSHALVPYFLVGSDRIATIHRKQAEIFTQLFPLVILELPIKIPGLTEMFQWHAANDDDAVLHYVRERLSALQETAEKASTARR
ncbi:MAG: LysR family transcriptional regulator [Pseudomonadota bacterium]